MSLLLDARKKSQQAQSPQDGDRSPAGSGLSLDAHPDAVAGAANPPPPDTSRSTGKNLFAAKSPAPSAEIYGINRNLLLALGGTVSLFALGAGYWWYLDSSSDTTPLRPISARPSVPQQPAAAEPRPQTGLVAGITAPEAAAATPPAQLPSLPAADAPAPPPRKISPIHIEQQQTELIDPLLGNAYLAYRNGKLDDAQQLYQQMLAKDPRSTDALLGLAAIAQQRSENLSAAQYYSRVLELDPRNAAANAGMAALSTNDNSESRLKTLLREQKDSAALHFALGNLYAEQARWGEAQQAYFNAYMLESGNAEFAFNLAVSLDHLGQNRSAAQYYQRALQLDQQRSAGFDHAQTERRILELTR